MMKLPTISRILRPIRLGFTLAASLAIALVAVSCDGLYENYIEVTGRDLADARIVTFDANGGTGTMGKLPLASGAMATLPSNGFMRKDYTFVGWVLTPSATKADYKDKATFTMEKSSVTLYALWESVRASSHDASLKSISLSSGSLSPAFSAETTAYTVSVANSITTVRVTGTKNSANATVSGPVVLSGLAADTPQTATITVTAEDGTTTKAYTVAVTRNLAPEADATLFNIMLTSGTLSPAFNPAITAYSVSVDTTVSSVLVVGILNNEHTTVTGPVTLNNLVVGTAQTATLMVTSQDGTMTIAYSVTVTRQASSPQSSDATLRALSVSTGTLAPTFGAANLTYAVSVPYSVSSITVTGTKNDSKATVSSNSGTAQDLDEGPNAIEIVVTAEDGTKKTYTVTVTRAAYVPVGTVQNLPSSADGSYDIGDVQPLVISGGQAMVNNILYTLKFDVTTGAVLAYLATGNPQSTGFIWDGVNLMKNGVIVPKSTAPAAYNDLPSQANGTWWDMSMVHFTIDNGVYTDSLNTYPVKMDSRGYLFTPTSSGYTSLGMVVWNGTAFTLVAGNVTLALAKK